jgi:hypothetical protein
MLHRGGFTLVARWGHSNHQKEVLERSDEELDNSNERKSIDCTIDSSAPANPRPMDAMRMAMHGFSGMVLECMVAEPYASLSNGQCNRPG